MSIRTNAGSQQTSSEFLDDVLLAAADRQFFIQTVQLHGPVRFTRVPGFLIEADNMRSGHQAAAMNAHELICELLLEAGKRLFHEMLPRSRAYGYVLEFGPKIANIGHGYEYHVTAFLH